jgi:hypothetical protein
MWKLEHNVDDYWMRNAVASNEWGQSHGTAGDEKTKRKKEREREREREKRG